MTSLPSGVEDDPTREFAAGIPAWFRLDLTQRLIANIAKAIENGWKMDDLILEATRNIPRSHANPGALVTYRVCRAVEHGPKQPDGPAMFIQPKPWCGDCDAPGTRWIETVDGRLMRCPRCYTKPTKEST